MTQELKHHSKSTGQSLFCSTLTSFSLSQAPTFTHELKGS